VAFQVQFLHSWADSALSTSAWLMQRDMHCHLGTVFTVLHDSTWLMQCDIQWHLGSVFTVWRECLAGLRSQNVGVTFCMQSGIQWHIATHCNTLQYAATHCNTLYHVRWHTTQPDIHPLSCRSFFAKEPYKRDDIPHVTLGNILRNMNIWLGCGVKIRSRFGQ